MQPTLQVVTQDSKPDHQNLPIFALGDVAEHGGPQMARAGIMQADVVVDNIMNVISGRPCLRTYKPKTFFESAIKLTLGKSHRVIFAMDDDGSDILIPERKDSGLDLGIERAWAEFGADFRLAERPQAPERVS